MARTSVGVVSLTKWLATHLGLAAKGMLREPAMRVLENEGSAFLGSAQSLHQRNAHKAVA